MKAKKYALSMIAVYMAYLTHGIQALIFSQNKINFATQWGFDMTNPESATTTFDTPLEIQDLPEE